MRWDKVKIEVRMRDGHECQVDGCLSNARLTCHHVKHRKNGGKDKPRNVVSVCQEHHTKYNKGFKIKIANNPDLPAHIRGKTFQTHIGVMKEKNPRKRQISFLSKAVLEKAREIRTVAKMSLGEDLKRAVDIGILFRWLCRQWNNTR